MSPLFAFLHHVAAFALFGSLMAQHVLLQGEITPRTARRILAADAMLGGAAMTVLIVGLLRVFLFEKGAGYYFGSLAFLLKLALFAAAGAASAYPTVRFAAWRRALARGDAPAVDAATLGTIRTIVRIELAAVVLILLFAALMAKGVRIF